MQVTNHRATRPLEFALSTLALVAVAVRRMLKTRVTLGNISRALLNLIKRSIFLMFKDSFPSVHAVNSYLLFSSPITAASCLNCFLALSVWLLS